MATSKEFKEYVVEQLAFLGDIMCRPMMGEYLLYYNGLLFGGIYDGRVLIKTTTTNEKFGLKKELPYQGAKLMYCIEDLEDQDLLKDIVLCTCEGMLQKVK